MFHCDRIAVSIENTFFFFFHKHIEIEIYTLINEIEKKVYCMGYNNA